VFCSNQIGNNRQMDLFGPGIDVKLKEKKERKNQTKIQKFFFNYFYYKTYKKTIIFLKKIEK
jgi:hypothetical protein